MRCPACGTENTEPDSRFCPHCGGRMGGGAEPRVAPTVKIVDGNGTQTSRPERASVPLFPPYVAPQSAPPPDVIARSQSHPPVASAGMPRTSSAPPGMHGMGSGPRPGALAAESEREPTTSVRPSNRNMAQPVKPSAPNARPAAPETLGDETPKRGGRRWGLIVVLLIIDLGLAGSGAFMLIRGLAAP